MAYYLWTRFLVDYAFKKVIKYDKLKGPMNKLGRCYFITGKNGKYDQIKVHIANKIAYYACKIMKKRYGIDIEAKKLKAPHFAMLYVNQSGFPFFHPKRAMIKLYPMEIMNFDIPGHIVVDYQGHLEYDGHNTFCAIDTEIEGMAPDLASYLLDVRDSLELQAKRTQKAVTLDAELNKSLTLKSSAFVPPNIKDWAERLKKEKTKS